MLRDARKAARNWVLNPGAANFAAGGAGELQGGEFCGEGTVGEFGSGDSRAVLTEICGSGII